MYSNIIDLRVVSYLIFCCISHTQGGAYPVVVMDGIEGLTFHVCAEGGCPRSPTSSMSRFCLEHANLEVSNDDIRCNDLRKTNMFT